MVNKPLSFTLGSLSQQKTALGRSDVHVWMADLSDFKEKISFLERLLSRDELDRSKRFVKADDCERYVFSHGFLRLVLAHYLAVSPGSLIFDAKEGLKPSLSSLISSFLEFNLSHSGGRVLVGVSQNLPLGVDIEWVRSGLPVESLARRVCTRHEYDQLMTLSGSEQLEAFYSCWTLKESFIKAIGKGLSFPLDGIEVDFMQLSAFERKDIKIEGVMGSSWFFYPLDAGFEYKAAVCTLPGVSDFFCYECKDLQVLDSFHLL